MLVLVPDLAVRIGEDDLEVVRVETTLGDPGEVGEDKEEEDETLLMPPGDCPPIIPPAAPAPAPAAVVESGESGVAGGIGGGTTRSSAAFAARCLSTCLSRGCHIPM
jgi:hypothetical protein